MRTCKQNIVRPNNGNYDRDRGTPRRADSGEPEREGVAHIEIVHRHEIQEDVLQGAVLHIAVGESRVRDGRNQARGGQRNGNEM